MTVVHGGSHRLIGNVLIQSSGIVLIAGNVPFDYTGRTVLPGLEGVMYFCEVRS